MDKALIFIAMAGYMSIIIGIGFYYYKRSNESSDNFFLFVVVPMMRGQGAKAPQRPWEGAEGLEWEVPSPAPFHTFENPPKLDATATRVIG